MRERLFNAPALACTAEIAQVKASLDLVRSLCAFTPTELDIWTHMRQILDNTDRPSKAYCHLIATWDVFTTMGAYDFARFVNTSNVTSIVLQTHFLALEELSKPWLDLQLPAGRAENHQAGCAIEALLALAEADTASKAMLDWPTKYIRAAHARGSGI